MPKRKDVVWVGLEGSRPLFCLAGIWTEFRGERGTKSKPIPGPYLVYGFLTTSPNAIVAPIHPKEMPVILAAEEEREGVDTRVVGRGEGAARRLCVENRRAWCRKGG